jgi:hypothetical protein
MKDGQAGKDGNPKDGDPKDGNPKDGNPKDGNPKDGNPKDGNPKDGKLLINPVFWALALGVALSLAVFARYLAGEELSDESLYKLLAILRYSAFFACVCSLYLVIASAAQLIKRPGALTVFKIILFLFAALYGAGIVVFTFFITAIAAGNS